MIDDFGAWYLLVGAIPINDLGVQFCVLFELPNLREEHSCSEN
jgi:hypothetical protein